MSESGRVGGVQRGWLPGAYRRGLRANIFFPLRPHATHRAKWVGGLVCGAGASQAYRSCRSDSGFAPERGPHAAADGGSDRNRRWRCPGRSGAKWRVAAGMGGNELAADPEIDASG